ncbi:arsenate reductase/protein-tyrosine-phosphatase family protein [Geodermatophilus sp. SYSU D00815]
MPARVLVVCEGNVCRSPAAEVLLRSGLGEGTGIEVASAGLGARVGEPVDEPVRRLLQARGLTADGRARQLTPDLVRAADVVLAMTAAQRAAVVSRVPAAVRRVFVLRELAALARLAGPLEGPDPAGRLAAVVASAGRLRALRGPATDDDVPDPYRRGAEAHARAFDLVAEAVADLVAALAPAAVHAP